MNDHACGPPLLARLNEVDVLIKCDPGGELWRCECGQLWQNSIAKNGWIKVTPEYERAFDRLGIPLPPQPES